MKKRTVSFAITTGLLVSTILLGALAERRIPEPLDFPLDQIGTQISGWSEIGQQQLDPRTLKTLDPTSYLARTYRKGALQLDLFIAYYAQQRAGESMHSPQHCLPGAGWEIMRRDSTIVRAKGNQVEVNKFLIQNLGTNMVILYWYQSRSRIVANEYWAKLLLARDTALTGLTGGSIVRIMLPDNKAAIDQGLIFAADLIPRVQHCLGSELHSAHTN